MIKSLQPCHVYPGIGGQQKIGPAPSFLSPHGAHQPAQCMHVVLCSRSLRKLSASVYLSAICVCDTCVLLTYVLLDWLNRGMRRWPGGAHVDVINHTGNCQAFLFLSYLFRFTSVWLIIVFTFERSESNLLGEWDIWVQGFCVRTSCSAGRWKFCAEETSRINNENIMKNIIGRTIENQIHCQMTDKEEWTSILCASRD